MKELKERLAQQIYGKSFKEVIESGLCIHCGEPALEKCYSAAGRKEYKISGLCERCFDEITKES